MLDALPRDAASPSVLPAARNSGSFAGLPDAPARIVARAGLDGVTAHILRYSFASVAGDLGFSDSTIGAMLGHTGSTITSRSVYHLDAMLLAAADQVARSVGQAIQIKAKA